MFYVFEVKEVAITEAGKLRIEKAEANNLCVGCMQPHNEKRKIRGCHESCYKATTRAIERGITTEVKRVSEGKLLPSNVTGRPPSNPVTMELRKCG